MKRAVVTIRPVADARFAALESLPAYWRGRAIGRQQATEAMDLSRDVLADHQAIADYERRAQECGA